MEQAIAGVAILAIILAMMLVRANGSLKNDLRDIAKANNSLRETLQAKRDSDIRRDDKESRLAREASEANHTIERLRSDHQALQRSGAQRIERLRNTVMSMKLEALKDKPLVVGEDVYANGRITGRLVDYSPAPIGEKVWKVEVSPGRIEEYHESLLERAVSCE